MKRSLIFSAVLGFSFSIGWTAEPDLGNDEQRQSGKQLYDKYCAQCHGIEGDGLGEAAPYLKPKPRDFTEGKYKVRSTPNGTLPTDEDLERIIRDGMPYTGMPPWPASEISDTELQNIIYYLKTFYPGFSDADELAEPIEIPSAPSLSEESAQRGAEVYVASGCDRCHGDEGRGDGQSGPTLADDWGFHIRPADFTMPWTFRGGSSREDIYRTLMTGFNGTPMPSFEDEGALAPDDRWPLVDYIYSRSATREANYANLLVAVEARGEIDPAQGPEQFEHAPLARFPVVGQIMEPGRDFYPSATAVDVRAIYNNNSIGLLVQWNDMKAETTGRNSPALEVPPFDPEAEMDLETIRQEQPDPFGGAAADPFAAFTAGQTETAGTEGTTRQTEFSDAVAIQFPSELTTGPLKPYFIFGDGSRSVDLWLVDLADGQPQMFVGTGSDSVEPARLEPFEAVSNYEDGRWSVIFKRRRVVSGNISFEQAQFVPIAFSVWDGFNNERGNKRGLTSWFHIYLEPLDKPSPIGPMFQYALAILAIEAILIFSLRRKHSRSRNEKVEDLHGPRPETGVHTT